MSILTNVMDSEILPRDLLNELGEEPEANEDPAMAIGDSEIEARLESWLPCYRLDDDLQHYQLRQMVIESIRIQRCQNHEMTSRNRLMMRAEGCWDQDRFAQVVEIASKLHRNPERWRAELVRSAGGCQWIIGEWELLLASLEDQPKGWDERQTSKALDLLGFPTTYRQGKATLEPPDDAPPEFLKQLAETEIAKLRELRTRCLDSIESAERDVAAAGLVLPTDRMTMGLRRFEAGCQRRFRELLHALEPYRIHGPKVISPAPKSADKSFSNQYVARQSATERWSEPRGDVSASAPFLKDLPPRQDPAPFSPRGNPSSPTSESSSLPDLVADLKSPSRTNEKAAPNRRERRKAAAQARKRARR